VFQQEVLAWFVEDAGGVFRFVRDAVDVGREDNEPYNIAMQYYMGVDIARIHDFTVLSIFDNTGRQVYFARFHMSAWESQLDRIAEVATAYHAKVFMDSTGAGDPLVEQLKHKLPPDGIVHIEGVNISAITKEKMCDTLALALERKGIRLLDKKTQTQELLAFQYDIGTTGVVRMHAPHGMHDDCVIAAALAVSGMMSKSEPAFGGTIIAEDIWKSSRVGGELWH
jgi:phage FluMu gp28-like protein